MLEELGRHIMLKVGRSQECPNCRGCKELVKHVLLECASHDSQRLSFLNCSKKVHPLDSFEAFLLGSIFNKTAFLFRRKAR